MDTPDKTLNEGKLIQAILRRIAREVQKLQHLSNHIQCLNPTEHANLDRSTIDEEGLTSDQAARLKRLVAGEEMAAMCKRTALRIMGGVRGEMGRFFSAGVAQRFPEAVAIRLLHKCGLPAASRAVRLYPALEELRTQAGHFNGGIAVEGLLAEKSSPAWRCRELLQLLGPMDKMTNNQARKTVYGLRLLAGLNPED